MSSRAPRLHHPGALPVGDAVPLGPGAVRHVQVLRLQPGDTVSLFDGVDRQVRARIERIERRAAVVRVEAVEPALPEPAVQAWLAIVVPANDRMDAVVEKATELGVAGLQPLWSQRSVVRLDPGRAAQRREHWQAVAVAASEQCGRCRVPEVRAASSLADWLREGPLPPHRVLLSPGAAEPAAAALRRFVRAATDHPAEAMPAAPGVVALSGPEGGLTEAERQTALDRGFVEVSLGPRVLRADTAPLAWLAHLLLGWEVAAPQAT